MIFYKPSIIAQVSHAKSAGPDSKIFTCAAPVAPLSDKPPETDHSTNLEVAKKWKFSCDVKKLLIYGRKTHVGASPEITENHMKIIRIPTFRASPLETTVSGAPHGRILWNFHDYFMIFLEIIKFIRFLKGFSTRGIPRIAPLGTQGPISQMCRVPYALLLIESLDL